MIKEVFNYLSRFTFWGPLQPFVCLGGCGRTVEEETSVVKETQYMPKGGSVTLKKSTLLCLPFYLMSILSFPRKVCAAKGVNFFFLCVGGFSGKDSHL